MTVFVVTMRAVAGPKNSTPDGLPYDILAFVRAATEAEAEQSASEGLGALGWIEGYVLRTGEITTPEATPEDLKPALERAERDGCALIVYEAS